MANTLGQPRLFLVLLARADGGGGGDTWNFLLNMYKPFAPSSSQITTTSTPTVNFFTDRIPFLPSNRLCQSSRLNLI